MIVAIIFGRAQISWCFDHFGKLPSPNFSRMLKISIRGHFTIPCHGEDFQNSCHLESSGLNKYLRRGHSCDNLSPIRTSFLLYHQGLWTPMGIVKAPFWILEYRINYSFTQRDITMSHFPFPPNLPHMEMVSSVQSTSVEKIYASWLVPSQDGLFALILWYVAKTLFWS